MFHELLSYKQRFGHCNVPKEWAENSELGGWCARQRQLQKKARLDPARIARLEALGFIWQPQAAVWDGMFRQLRVFKERFGHCNVQRNWQENPALGVWSQTLRSSYREKSLAPEWIARLEALGFVWHVHDSIWETRFRELVDYKERFGDCNLPQHWPENPALADWCGKQRKANNIGKVSAERIARLEALGFEWSRTNG